MPTLCRSAYRTADVDAHVDESTAAVQWEIAIRHGLGPILAHHWKIDGQVLSQALGAVIDQHELQTRQRSRLMAAYGRAILAALQKDDLKIIVYKGLPLSIHLYGDDIVRSSGDIDVLVRSEDLVAVATHLERLGLTCGVASDWLTRRLFTEKFFEVEWRDQMVGVEVDVHWRLAPSWTPHVDVTSQLLCGRTQISVGGQMWPWCSAAQIWYIQLIELIKADWLEPKSLVSFAHAWDIVLRDGDEDAAGLLLRTLPATLADCTVLLLNDSLHRRVPDKWIEDAQQNWLARAATRCIYGVYFAPQPNEKRNRARWLLRTVRYISCGRALPKTVVSRVFTPHYRDLAAVPPTASGGRLVIAKVRRLLFGHKRQSRPCEN